MASAYKNEYQPSLRTYDLHAVVINKNVPFEEARRISKNFIEKNRNFYRETENSYRFRNLPKQKFVKDTFRSKKINKDITLVYGQIAKQR